LFGVKREVVLTRVMTEWVEIRIGKNVSKMSGRQLKLLGFAVVQKSTKSSGWIPFYLSLVYKSCLLLKLDQIKMFQLDTSSAKVPTEIFIGLLSLWGCPL
jgi:hypothetical protein